MRRSLLVSVLGLGSIVALVACGGEGTGTSSDRIEGDTQVAPGFGEPVPVATLDTFNPSDTTASTSVVACADDAAVAAPDAGTCTSCVDDAAAPPPPPTPVVDAGAACVACGCTLTQGYWKNYASAWPVTTLTIGGVAYGQAELLRLFATPPRGDASVILAHQLVAAMLNRATGAGATAGARQAIDDANAWLAAHVDADGRLPFGITSTSSAGATAVQLADTLDAYNNGNAGPAHCN